MNLWTGVFLSVSLISVTRLVRRQLRERHDRKVAEVYSQLLYQAQQDSYCHCDVRTAPEPFRVGPYLHCPQCICQIHGYRGTEQVGTIVYDDID